MTGLRAAAVGVSGSAASGASSQRPCPGVSPEQLKGPLLPGGTPGTVHYVAVVLGDPLLGPTDPR